MNSIRSRKIILILGIALIGFSSPIKAKKEEITDKNITAAVERKIFLSHPVPEHLIDVSVNKGIVTLNGTVQDLLAKDYAVKAAGSIRGVRSVINQLKVKPVDRSDGDIRKDIRRAFLFDPATDSYEIDVDVDEGNVTLSGTVQSWAEKKLVQHVAMGVKGIKNINNNIVVKYKSNRPDSEIKAEVERRLENDPYVNAFLIDVKVKDGKVIMTGSLDSAAGITYTAIDGWVAGVKEVDNSRLEVRPWLKLDTRRAQKVLDKSDKKIKKAVKDAFLYDPRVWAFKIGVEVDNRNVILAGKVNNLKAKKAAAQDAKNTVGVRTVINKIKVRPIDAPQDSDIEHRIESAFMWDPLLERHNINAVVRNKKAYLYGSVDSAYEKWRAEDVASRIFGVAEIKNNLAILGDWVWKSDGQIKEDIENELFWSPFVDSEDIKVKVEDGRAILTGTVSHWLEYDSVLENAWEGGARVVESQLQFAGMKEFFPSVYDTPPYY